MAKPDYFLIVDTETTMTDLVADFGAVVVNKKGDIMAQCGILTFGIYNDSENHPLFHNEKSADLWKMSRLAERYENYNAMLKNGTRQLSSVAGINKWLEKVERTYTPYLTAYNLTFDNGKCYNTGIDLTRFNKKKFCLWYASVEKWAFTKKYRQFILDNNFFKNATKPTPRFPLGNLSYPTNAEVMTRFIANDALFPDEPHTALEDVLEYELPLLLKLVNTTKKKVWQNPKPFNWQAVQVKDWYIPK